MSVIAPPHCFLQREVSKGIRPCASLQEEVSFYFLSKMVKDFVFFAIFIS